MTRIIYFWPCVLLLSLCDALTDVSNLVGDADFRSVVLRWKYPKSESASSLSGFLVTYCEDQAWGKYRCKKKLLEELSKNEILNSNGENVFATTLNHLRMSTNYTVEVSPMFSRQDANLNRGRSIGSLIKIRTKGFSARAIRCLANHSLVEIETGPYFGGKISVEGTTSKQCSTQGDYSDPKTSYFLKINHRLCGSNIFNSSVKTFIIVQENLPILTHSTRRFMVVCKYSPETFTVRAGVNLPYEDEEESFNNLVPVDEDVVEVDPSELFDSTNNNLFSSRASKQVGRALRFSTESEKEPQRLSHVVLMVIMVIAATVGMVIAVWQFVHRIRKSNRSGFMSPQVEPSAISIDENLEAIVRDFGDSLDGSLSGCSSQTPPVALVSVKDSSPETTLPDS